MKKFKGRALSFHGKKEHKYPKEKSSIKGPYDFLVDIEGWKYMWSANTPKSIVSPMGKSIIEGKKRRWMTIRSTTGEIVDSST